MGAAQLWWEEEMTVTLSKSVHPTGLEYCAPWPVPTPLPGSCWAACNTRPSVIVRSQLEQGFGVQLKWGGSAAAG